MKKKILKQIRVRVYLLERWFRHKCPTCKAYTISEMYGCVETKICPNKESILELIIALLTKSQLYFIRFQNQLNYLSIYCIKSTNLRLKFPPDPPSYLSNKQLFKNF